MMQRVEYTSQLTSDDIRIFLAKYAGMNFCNISEMYRRTELIVFLVNDGIEYMMVCSDFEMRIVKMSTEIEKSHILSKPSADDWFCFLKSKFGINYMKHYAKIFEAKDILFYESKFISQMSYHSMLILIRILLEENNKTLQLDLPNTEIIEVESFYRSERRFLVSDRNKEFYLRVSDIEVVTPRLNCEAMYRFMAGKFGNDYLLTYHNTISKYIQPGIIPTFDEYTKKEDLPEIQAYAE